MKKFIHFKFQDESEILKVLLGLIKANFIMRANQYSKGFILKDELGGEEEQKDHINVKRKRKGKEKLTIKRWSLNKFKLK